MTDSVFLGRIGVSLHKIESLKPRHGIYFLIDGTEIRYIGQSTNIDRRIDDHIREGRIKFDKARCLLVSSQFSLDEVESDLIRYFKPYYNAGVTKMGEVSDLDLLDTLALANSIESQEDKAFNDLQSENIKKQRDLQFRDRHRRTTEINRLKRERHEIKQSIKKLRKKYKKLKNAKVQEHNHEKTKSVNKQMVLFQS